MSSREFIVAGRLPGTFIILGNHTADEAATLAATLDLTGLDWPVLVIGPDALAPYQWDRENRRARYVANISDAFIRDGTPITLWRTIGARSWPEPVDLAGVCYYGDHIIVEYGPEPR